MVKPDKHCVKEPCKDSSRRKKIDQLLSKGDKQKENTALVRATTDMGRVELYCCMYTYRCSYAGALYFLLAFPGCIK